MHLDRSRRLQRRLPKHRRERCGRSLWIHTLEMPCVGIPKTWIEINNLVGGNWNMIFVDFPSYMGCHPNPIDELIFFKIWLKPLTRICRLYSIVNDEDPC
jgi:hypothetical protein